MSEPYSGEPNAAAEDALEALVQEYLIALGEHREVDRVEFAARLTDPAARRRFLVIVLCEEVLDRQRGGTKVDLDAELAELTDRERRDALRYIETSLAAGSSRPRPLPPGTLLAGRYRVRQQIASGGTALIYQARDEEFGVDRTLKALNHEAASSQAAEDWEALVLGEARMLARLESRNIVTVHDIVRDGERSYIVMDYLRGRDLERVLRDVQRRAVEGAPAQREGHTRPRPEWIAAAIGQPARGEYRDLLTGTDWYRCAARLVRQAVQALELAHGEGICHRDIKPANLLLVGGGEPVLLDFGFGAGTRAAAGLDQRLIGTPEYMAPEQFRQGRAGNDPRTDLYQMGVVLYELTTLHRPYERHAPDFLDKKCAGEHAPASGVDAQVPAALEAIITMAMCAEPGGRYASAQEMRVDLERFVAGKPPRHAPLRLAARATSWARWTATRPVFLVAMAGAIVLALALALRTESWFPPAVIARHRLGGEATRVSNPEQPIRWSGGSLDIGLTIDASRPSFLYAFELYGEVDGPRFVRALLWEEGLAALAVDASDSTPVLSVDEASGWEVEELFVLATEHESDALEEYIAALEESRAMGVDHPFDAERFDDVLSAPSRGVSRAEMTNERRTALARAFAPGAELTDAEYAELGLKPYRFRYRIDYEGDGE